MKKINKNSIIVLLVIFFLVPNLFVQGSYVKLTSVRASQINSTLPVRLKIPKIKINATLEQVGLTADGAVGVPKGILNAAWFKKSVRPGENGSAIIDGHFGRWKNGKPAIFNNLFKLRKGDRVYVEDDAGKSITFIVRESRLYNQYDEAAEVFDLSDNKAHLNLITCEGIWDKISKSYSKRLVVFTDKE
ncbi:MAG: class F sortase [Patescibacteria group bacterium]